MTGLSYQPAQSMEKGQLASPLGAMSSLVTLAGLCGSPLPMARALEEMGWNVQRLGTLGDKDEEMIAAVLLSVEEKLGVSMEAEPLIALIEVAATAAEVAWRVEGATSGAELLVAHEQKKLQDKLSEWRTLSAGRLMEKVPVKGTAVVPRWPTRLQRKLQEAGDDQRLRDRAEKEERSRWIKELRDLLRDGDCPAVRDESRVREMSRRFGKGRRASTLRKHVKTWTKLSQWMIGTFKKPWPRHPAEVVAYLEALSAEPCGRTIPSSVFKTLMFMENAGEVNPEDQLCKRPAIKNALEEINMELASQTGGFTKRAWHIPLKILESFEETVMDDRAPRYARAYAWFRLVKLWTGMRFADTKGLEEQTLEMGDQGLTGVLTRTKTSGPGKRVVHLRIWVNVECWLKRRHWLDVGFDIWKDMGRAANLLDRDFALPYPSRDLDGFAKKMADYAAASKCSQALFNDLKTEFEDAVVPLLECSVGLLWSEHSERATIRTWADATGISEPVKKQMGRWVPTADQSYERTGRFNVLRAQKEIANFVRDNKGRKDPFDEAAVFAAMTEKMVEMGFPEGVMDIQVEKLTSFGIERNIKRIKLTEAGAVDASDDEEWHLIGERGGPDEKLQEKPRLDDDDEDLDEEGLALGSSSSIGAMPPHGTYVLSVIGRSKRRTLHRIGECHRVPGVHYSSFEIAGDEPPRSSEFHQSCKQCFPRGLNEGEKSSSEEMDDELSSSDSSTSVEDSEEVEA